MKRALLLLLVASAAVAEPRVIVIDAGHGGEDPGGVGTGKQEKNIVLDVTKRFEALLVADTADAAGGGEWTAKLTRKDDTFVSLAARAEYSNNQGADRFMSIHSNAFGDAAANGTETFSLSSTGTGAALRNLVQEEMLAAWGLTNRGNKTANFAVLRDTAAPAVLHELAFITNVTDAEHLGSPDERQKAAVAHLRALQRHYNLAPYVPGAPAGTGEIGGHVFDATGPIEGATLSLDGGGTVSSAADGTYVLPGVAVGTRTLTVSADGHVTKVLMVAVAAGARAETDIELEVGEGGDPGSDPSDTAGGCSAGYASTPVLAVFALVSLRRRRRR